MEEVADKIIESVIITIDPNLNARRSEHEEFLTELYKYDDLKVDEIVLTTLRITKFKAERSIISEHYLENIEFIVLSILEKYIINKWNNFSDQDKIRIRNNLLLISIHEYNTNNNLEGLLISSNSAIRKLSCIIGLVIINDNFYSWKIFMNNILEARNSIKNENNLDIKVDKLTRLIFGIINEIVDTFLMNSNSKLNSKIRVSVIHGIRDEIEPILYLLCNDIQGIFKLITNNPINSNINMIFIVSRTKLCFYTLKNLTNIIDSTSLIKLKLDELLINILLSEINMDIDEEIIDLLKHLMYNLKKNKRNYFSNLEYCDINRFSIGISKLVRNIVLYPQLMSENPKYDNYLKQIYLVELFKDLTELTFNYITKFPDNIIFDSYGNKHDTILHMWNTCTLLLLHPNILICDLSVSSVIFMLKNISKDSKLIINNIEKLNINILIVIIFTRSIRIGDPYINYISNEWNEWNIIISNMLINSLNKLNSDKLNVFSHFPSQNFCYSYIISKYSALYDQYNVTNTENINIDYVNNYKEQFTGYNSSFYKLFGALKNRIISLINILIDFEYGIVLNILVETILNISTYMLSSQTFNKRCEKHLNDINSSNCKKLIILDSIFFFIESIISRLNYHTSQDYNYLSKYYENNDINSKYFSNSPSYMDLLITETNIKKGKTWLILFYKLIDGILNLNLIQLCGFSLENRKLLLMSNSIICINWYKDLFSTNNSCLNINYYLRTFLYYISYSGNDNDIKELRKASGYLFSKLLLNNSNLFKGYVSEIICVIKETLNLQELTNDERNILTSVLIAVTNATCNYSEISQFSLIASNKSIEFILGICNNNKNDNILSINNLINEPLLNFMFGSLIDILKTNDCMKISEKDWNNLLQIKNSLHLIYSLFVNINLPYNYLDAYSGGFIDKINNKLILKHPLEKISITVFESICFLFSIFNTLSSLNIDKSNNESVNYLYLLNTISDQEWINRSDTKNLNDIKIQKLSKIISYNYIFNKNINTIRRITSFIRITLLKIIASIFTLGTGHEILINDEDKSDFEFITYNGFYFDDKYTNLLIKVLIEPILTTPIYILNSIVKNCLCKILSPNLIPKCVENDYKIVLFLENIFTRNFIPSIINKLNIEWNNLMKCQSYMLLTSLNDLKNKCSIEDPFSVLFKTDTPFECLTEDLKDNNILNTVYISHYNDICEISLQVLKIIDQFFAGSKTQVHINNASNNKSENLEQQINFDVVNNKINRHQSKNIIISNIFYKSEKLLSSCFKLLSEFLNYPNSNILEQALHIIQKYLKHYNNNLLNLNLNNENFHLNIIKNILVELLKHSSKFFPFDPLNISQNENDINVSTPLSSYLLLSHTNIVRNVIQDAISCIIRSNQDCFDFIVKYKNELSKDHSIFSNEYKKNVVLNNQEKIIFTIDIPEDILNKAYNSLEFIIKYNNEYNPLKNNNLINQQDILLVSRLFIQEYIQDTISNSYFQIAIENLLMQVYQASRMAIQVNNYRNPYSELNTYISVLNFEHKHKLK
ncbi:hypothetical protein FG386_001520 [Cryptosporidium ryanae]|uniref:uncharacterized protein n=1 Tax=Cryptosporidium ryanae TaxID=515981 RepID=UPI00351A88FB|nr:hypothetical protein FG386_001520 [Cryptosporidium ryanae]